MSIDQFISARQVYREELGRHEAELMAQIKRLDDVLWDQPFSDDEKQTRKKLVDDLGVIRREQFFLAEIDIREFDRQPRIAELRAHFEGLKTDLDQRQAELKRLVGAIQTGTKVIQAVEKVVQQLAALM